MKKKFFCFICILFFRNFKSQVVFCPPGAEWHYSFSNSYNGKIVNEAIKYKGDTIINNETIKVISHKKCFRENNIGYASQTFLKQKGDTVFVKSQFTADSWQVLYNFGAIPGQSWQTKVYPYSSSAQSSSLVITYTVTVDSVGSVNVDNFNLKRLFVRYKSYADNLPVAITERFGCEGFMFNYKNTFVTDGDYFYNFLCYQDNAFGLKQFTDKACDFTGWLGIKENNYLNEHINIYPQPASDVFNIQFDNELFTDPVTLCIADVCGRTIKQLSLTTATSKIEIPDLEKGVYLLSIEKSGQTVYTGKLLKE